MAKSALQRTFLFASTALGLVFAAGSFGTASANTVNGTPALGQVINVQNGSPSPVAGAVSVVVNDANVLGPGSIGQTANVTSTSRTNSAAIEVNSNGANSVAVAAGRLVGAHNSYSGIWINPGSNASLSSATLSINGDVQGYNGGVEVKAVCSESCGQDMSSISVSGSGRIYGNATALMLNAYTNITLDGLGLVSGNGTGINLSTTALSNSNIINVGQTSRLGEVNAATGNGLSLTQTRMFALEFPRFPIVLRIETSGTANVRLSSITAGADAVKILGMATSLSFNGSLYGLGNGIYTQSRSLSINGEGTGTIRSGQDGISYLVQGWSEVGSGSAGSLLIQDIASITSSRHGIVFSTITSGNQSATIDGVGAINSGGDAIRINSFGPVRIGTTTRLGAINSGAIGVSINLTEPSGGSRGNSAPVVRLSSVTAGIGINWYFSANSLPIYNDTAIFDVSGLMQTSSTGIYLYRYAGPISITGSGTGSIVAGGNGIQLVSGLWRAPTTLDVQNFTSIAAPAGDAIVMNNYGALTVAGIGSIQAGGTGISSKGSTTINGVGSINAGVRGIDVLARAAFESGNIIIGTTTFNGAITGGVDGIRVDSTGFFNLFSNAAITGTTGFGIFHVGDSTSYLELRARVSGGTGGISLTNLGTSAIAVYSGVVIEGATGIALRSTGVATASLSNFGTVRSTVAPGIGNDFAIATNGQVSVSNFGTITGRVSHNDQIGSNVSSLGFYNVVGGVWNVGPGDNRFLGAADIVGNSGTINLAAGATQFTGLETLINNSGGVINLQGSSAATDELTIGGALQLSNTGRIKVNFDADAALGTLDRGTTGNADTILANNVTPSGITLVDILATGGTNGAGSPTPLTGSVAIVSAGAALAAPTAGATLVNSANYSFGIGNPTSAARTFALVGDGAGGVFLQWVPVIGIGSMGGFAGGALGVGAPDGGSNGAGGGLGFLQASLSGAVKASGRVADMTGFGAAFGGNGAAGATCQGGSGASFALSTGDTRDNGARAAGNDRALGPALGSSGCGGVSVGAFWFDGRTNTGFDQRNANGVRSDGAGGGGYLRADMGNGFYAQVTGASGQMRSSVRNAVFGTTALVDAELGLVEATAGWAKLVSDTLAFETRVTTNQISTVAAPFRDSLGFEVSSLTTRADSLSATFGLLYQANDTNKGFVRTGLRAVEARMDGLAYGKSTTSKDSGTGTLFEASWNQSLGKDASIELTLASDQGGPIQTREARVQYRLVW